MADIESEADLFKRPLPESIIQAWRSLFSDPLLSASRLKALALSKEGLGEEGLDGGIVLRSVYWRLYHGLLPSPASPEVFAPTLEGTRASYTSLRRRWLVAPDGRWASDCSYHTDIDAYTPPDQLNSPPPPLSPTSPRLPEGTVPGWDPLSLDGQSPWKTWFAHQDLRATIRQDVERTFPDIPYFRIEKVRMALTTALFMFSVMNSDVGYRQGMHELLAVCLLVVDRDSLEPTLLGEDADPLSPGSSTSAAIDSAMRVVLDRRYVEHDAFALFQEIMRGAKAFYEWRGEEGPRTKTPVAPQAPIILRCQNLHNSSLRRVDPQLWERFETEGLEPQIWAIRWIRLILTRELPFHLALRIWDGVFAEDPGLGILDYVCVAMLLLIRNELIHADYSTLLTSLLRYPSPSVEYAFHPHLILAQAIALRANVTPAGGVEVVLQNQEVLNIHANPPQQPDAANVSAPGRRPINGVKGGAAQNASPSRGVQGLAAGLFERAQAAGLDRTLLNTVADLRKNLPDAASAYSYLPNLPFSPGQTSSSQTALSSIPSSSALPHRSGFFSPPHISRAQHPTGSPIQPTPITQSTLSPRRTPPRQPSMDSNISIKSLRDAEREVAELRLAMMGMGKAMMRWMENMTVTAANTTGADPAPGRGIVEEGDTVAEEASGIASVLRGPDWTGLERVRDTLLDAAGSEHDDIVRQWAWHEGLEAPPSNQTSRGGTPSMSRSGSESFVGLAGEAIQIRNLDSSSNAIGGGGHGGRWSAGSVGGREEEVTPRQADTQGFSRQPYPSNNSAAGSGSATASTSTSGRVSQRPASMGVPDVTISTPMATARLPSRPTTLPPPSKVERISPTNTRTATRTSTGSSSAAASSGPRQLLLRPGISSTPPQPPKPSRPSLSERLSAASRPLSAMASPQNKQVSLSASPVSPPNEEDRSGQQEPPDNVREGTEGGDPLAGMGVGVSVPKSARKDYGMGYDPLGAGH